MGRYSRKLQHQKSENVKKKAEKTVTGPLNSGRLKEKFIGIVSRDTLCMSMTNRIISKQGSCSLCICIKSATTTKEIDNNHLG